MSDRYNIENLPISDKTSQGMNLNINDISIIGRMLAVQDEVYEDSFRQLNDLIKSQNALLETNNKLVKWSVDELKSLKLSVESLEVEVKNVAEIALKTRSEVEILKVEVDLLKKKNTWIAILLRAALIAASVLGVVRYYHGPFKGGL